MRNLGVNLVQMAKELLMMQDDLIIRIINEGIHSVISDYELNPFQQVWANTSGGFESVGGDAITTEWTYVFVPIDGKGECYVYFGGRFGYTAPFTIDFLRDVWSANVMGVTHSDAYKE